MGTEEGKLENTNKIEASSNSTHPHIPGTSNHAVSFFQVVNFDADILHHYCHKKDFVIFLLRKLLFFV